MLEYHNSCNSTQEKIAIMQAYLDGKTVEFREIPKTPNWTKLTGQPLWRWDITEYRIRPEPILRPWTFDECPVGAVIRSCGGFVEALILRKELKDRAKGEFVVLVGDVRRTPVQLLKQYQLVQKPDGPFGKMEKLLPCGVEE